MKKILFALFIPAFFVSIAAASTEEGKRLFESKCIKCHDLERALTKSKDLETWKITTLRMSRNSGA
jgi:cytochrome c